MSQQLHLALQAVHTDRAAEFERFLADVVRPAMRAHTPELLDRVQLLRATGGQDGFVTYAFLFQGGSLSDDWDLGVILPAQYGEGEAERIFQEWAGTFAPLRQWADAVATAGQESNQAVWTLEPVSLD